MFAYYRRHSFIYIYKATFQFSTNVSLFLTPEDILYAMPISPRLDDVSSDEDFDNRPRTRTLRKQRSFEDLVNNSPRSVATLLSRFHTRRDPKRYALIDELHNTIVVLDTPDDVMDGFIDSELPSLLMEIASDRSTYGKFRHDKNAEVSYSWQVLCRGVHE